MAHSATQHHRIHAKQARGRQDDVSGVASCLFFYICDTTMKHVHINNARYTATFGPLYS